MKKPATPPDATLETLVNRDEGKFDRLVKVMQLVDAPEANADYLHWDKLRFKTPPDGLSHQEWWTAVKFRRARELKEIPLKDTAGKPFRFSVPDPLPHDLHLTDKQAGGRIEAPEPIVNPHTRDRYYLSSVLEEAITSSQIEGAVVTREIAKEMIRTKRRPRDQDERMILNNFRTMRQLREYKDQSLTPELIFEIHRQMTEDTLGRPEDAGCFRPAARPVNVADMYNEVAHEPPAADELPGRMQAMCDFANEESPGYFIHPVIRSMILHFWLAYDHPFIDGNGRTARALFYWSMLHHGYWMFEYISISPVILRARTRYYRAFLLTETDDNDLTYFLLYHMELIRTALQDLHAYIDRKSNQVRALDQLVRDEASLNHRQRALLSHALRHPGRHYTTESHRVSHQVAYQTARNDLTNLEFKGLLKRVMIGRTAHFQPVKQLESKLRRLRD